MYFLIEDDGLLEKYNTVWDKLSADIKKNFIVREPVYNKNFLKNKIKSYGDEATGFHDKEMKVHSDYACLIVITIDSALEKR